MSAKEDLDEVCLNYSFTSCHIQIGFNDIDFKFTALSEITGAKQSGMRYKDHTYCQREKAIVTLILIHIQNDFVLHLILIARLQNRTQVNLKF